MLLEDVLGRCRAFEHRAAVIYRAFAARTRDDTALCAMWTALARDEEAHELALTRAQSWLEKPEGWHTDLSGWDEALDEIEARLAAAEAPDIGADRERQILAALALERTEMDRIHQRLRAVMHVTGHEGAGTDDHLAGLLAAAERSTTPAVQLEAALVRARLRLDGH